MAHNHNVFIPFLYRCSICTSVFLIESIGPIVCPVCHYGSGHNLVGPRFISTARDYANYHTSPDEALRDEYRFIEMMYHREKKLTRRRR